MDEEVQDVVDLLVPSIKVELNVYTNSSDGGRVCTFLKATLQGTEVVLPGNGSAYLDERTRLALVRDTGRHQVLGCLEEYSLSEERKQLRHDLPTFTLRYEGKP